MLRESEAQGLTISEMHNKYDHEKANLVMTKNAEFLFRIGNCELPYPKAGKAKAIRIDDADYSTLQRAKLHPEESFSYVLFRLCQYAKDRPPYELCFGIPPREKCTTEAELNLHDLAEDLQNSPVFQTYFHISFDHDFNDGCEYIAVYDADDVIWSLNAHGDGMEGTFTGELEVVDMMNSIIDGCENLSDEEKHKLHNGW
jgi:hypothetical protein